jgi:hypothetical protein
MNGTASILVSFFPRRLSSAADVVQQLMTNIVSDMHNNEVPSSLLEACLVMHNQRMVYKDCFPCCDQCKPQGM